MCGICGFFEVKNNSDLLDSKEYLLEMCRAMNHRGPDDRGIYLSGSGVGLGAVRLSIIDLSGGHQPVANEDDTCWVVLNGEIYNFPRLRQYLINQGHIFKSNSDTEVVVHAYEQWGLDCVEHLDGMFAFAVWDEKRQRLMLARDRLGKKPLYISRNENSLIFSSEIKSLMKHPSFSVDLDFESLDMFLTLGYIPGPNTIFRDTQKLLPGHYLTIDREQELNYFQYWDIPQNDKLSESGEQTNASQYLIELLEKSVKARLLSDVPVGVFLSGGLDSSLVTAIMKKYKTDHLKSFSVSFLEAQHDESSFARTVANHLGTEHFELAVNNCSPELLRNLVWHCDEPLADPAIVPTYLVSKLASEHVKVVLTGEGADELFAGYFYHPLERQAARLDWLQPWGKQQLLARSARFINKIIGRQRYHPRTIWAWQLKPAERMLAWMAIFTDEEKQRWFSPTIREQIANQYAAGQFQRVARDSNRQNWLASFSYLDIKIPLVDDLLMKVDKMSMAASLEARCPYLDHHIVEFTYALPESMKLVNGNNKVLLRQIAENWLPVDIVHRKKHGFDVPIRRWLTEDLQTAFWDLISSDSFKKLGVIEKSQVQRIWAEMEQNTPGSSRHLWSILILAIWCDVYIT